MRTKNILSIAALIICGLVCVNSVKADVPPTQTSDEVTVNIKFTPIQSIVVNSAQKTVNLVYATKDDYANGVSAEMPDHLEIFSTGGFEVKVSTDGDFTRTAGGTIDADDVTVTASTDNETFTGVALSTNPATLITATEGGRALKYNVTYDNIAAGKSDAYINKYISEDSEESVYTAKVTYTIATN